MRVINGMMRYFQKFSLIIWTLPLYQTIFPITHIFISQIDHKYSTITDIVTETILGGKTLYKAISC